MGRRRSDHPPAQTALHRPAPVDAGQRATLAAYLTAVSTRTPVPLPAPSPADILELASGVARAWRLILARRESSYDNKGGRVARGSRRRRPAAGRVRGADVGRPEQDEPLRRRRLATKRDDGDHDPDQRCLSQRQWLAGGPGDGPRRRQRSHDGPDEEP